MQKKQPSYHDWTKDSVIRRIKDRHAHGQPLTNIGREDPALYRSARRAFGGWLAAMQAAELGHMVPRQWSKRKVVSAIVDRKLSGHALSRTWKEDRPLFRAAVNHFGNWTAAMNAAGQKPIKRERWSKRRVIERLQAWEAKFGNGNVRHCDPKLADAATRLFGRLDTALEVAGLEPPPRRWTDARVIAAIQDRYIKGGPVHIEGLGDVRLANAAKRRFGSWANAVESAGLTGKVIIKKPLRRWTRDDVVTEIRAWHDSGRRLADVSKEHQPLYNAAKTHFGTWRKALTAAGFQSERRVWSKRAVLEEMQDRARNGRSLSSGDPANRNLAAVAHRHFGSWRKAIHAAGVLSHQANRKGA